MSHESLTYRDAGVDIERGNRLVERIKTAAHSTSRDGLIAGIGGFGALFELPVDRYRQPVLVSATDGVGTKLKLALATGRHTGVGIDLVAMCVNDILSLGAEPLYFLDYYATGQLDEALAAEVIEGIADGCRQAGAALIGGETAEMPGMYATGDYDLAGFCVGAVEKNAIIDGAQISPGQVILGLASSGPHSNGYSLIRKILEVNNIRLNQQIDGRFLDEVLMAPTRIYVKSVLALTQQVDVLGIAHITGGGLTENLPRILPPATRACLNPGAWKQPPVFTWLQDQGRITDEEMRRTFNCGIGLVIVLAEEHHDQALEILRQAGEEVCCIGRIQEHDGGPRIIYQ